ncbi:dehydrogenase E1 component subunit alpha/beta [uncultured Sphaerochaeta sp.]|uniref:alpha-ketoacid dehydrogenase subunit alpha/beta n=1 Tax=uncultured Sphaerochaeta sp. TaxID=886478 RepID=UPI002A0A8A5C|nr:dehydrogenase E1 component subunit alpha/beta [uncultured Sphaerochaeta sp.]
MDFSKEQATYALSLMVRSRHFEERIDEFFKHKQMHGTTHLSNGQEATQAGLSLALQDGDWIVPTHRCHGHTIARGTSERKMFSEMFGSSDGICQGLGGSMHMTDTEHWNAGASAVVGSGVPLALGLAFALKRQQKKNIGVAIFGDGASSRGSLHESMNIASVWNLPLLFFCENNGYGMSAPTREAVSTDSIASRSLGYGIDYSVADGNDVEAVYQAVLKAVLYIRKTSRPYFLEVQTYRYCGHSKSDGCVYRSREEEQLWKAKDPIENFSRKMVSCGLFTENEVQSIIQGAIQTINQAAADAEALKGVHISLEQAMGYLFSGDEEQTYGVCTKNTRISYRQAIHDALSEEMTKDPSVVLLGEDIGLYGGCFKVTGTLGKQFPSQVLETPVSEEAFTGLAVGASMLGIRPIVEIMYGDFSTLASDPLINHAAKLRFMSGGQLSCPMVLRTPMGSGTGHGAQHTQSLEAMFANVPGLVIVAPSCPGDAKALLKTSIRSNNPVLFFEHKMLYDSLGPVGDSGYLLPLGKAFTKKKGNDVTLVCYSHAVITCLEAAAILSAQDEIEAEVLDLSTLKPLDREGLLASVRKTGRVVIVHDAPEFGGYGAEVAALISSDPVCFTNLEAPVVRICGKESPIPFSPELEKQVIPTKEEIVCAVRKLF